MSQEFTSPSSAPGQGSGAASTSPAPVPSGVDALLGMRIAEFAPNGKPLRVEPIVPESMPGSGQAVQDVQQPLPPAPDTPPTTDTPSRINLQDLPEFREYQSNADRRFAQAQQAVQQRDQRLQAITQERDTLQRKLRELEINQRVQQAATPLEQEQVRTQAEREAFEQEREAFEQKRTAEEDMAQLHHNRQVYIRDWGIPAPELARMETIAWQHTNQGLQMGTVERGDELVQYHNILQSLTADYATRAYYARQRQQQAQPQQQAPTPPQPPVQQPAPQPVPAQVVARPATTVPVAPSLSDLRIRAMQSQRPEDWRAYDAAMRQGI
jgi:hypothetical protein